MTAIVADINGNPHWQAFGASSIGKAHIDSGLPNQDSFFYQRENDFCVAVVCDGAGSARFSQDGSKFFSQAVGDLLKNLAKNLLTNQAFDDLAINSQVPPYLQAIRDNLIQQINNDAMLRDYHTTVTAVLLLEPLQKALLIQVGDSPLLTSQFVINEHHIDYFKNLQLFGDDSKTEYINETHFITQDNWQDFLRVQWLDVANVDLIALMSDGCADLVLQGASQTPNIYRPFFGNLLFNVCQSQTGEQGSAMIEQAIGNPATYRLTGDDKSLIILMKNGTTYQGIEPIIEVEENPPMPSTMSASVWTTSADSVSSNAHLSTAPIPTVNAQANTQTANLQTPNPADKPLPQAVPISASSKQRRNTAVIASVAILAGAGVLGWLNWDKVSSIISPIKENHTITVSMPTPSPPLVNLPPIVPLQSQLAQPSTAYQLDNPLHIFNVGYIPLIQFILAVPKAEVSQLPLVAKQDEFVPVTVINPNVAPFNQVEDFSPHNPKTVNDKIIQTWKVKYDYSCRVIDKELDNYRSLKIKFDDKHQYRFCQMTLEEMAVKLSTPPFDKRYTQLIFEKGLTNFFDGLNFAETTYASQVSAVLPKNAQSIKVYYLPNNFSPNQSVTK